MTNMNIFQNYNVQVKVYSEGFSDFSNINENDFVYHFFQSAVESLQVFNPLQPIAAFWRICSTTFENISTIGEIDHNEQFQL